LILLGAAVLRFYHLGASSLWSDEGNTWALLSRSFGQIARDAAADIHPPGYYWLLKLWSIPFGTSATAMRSFSALLGVLLVYLIYCLGCHLRPAHHQLRLSWPALVAAFLAALNPFQIYYSQEARMYLLLAVAGAVLMLALFSYLARETTRNTAWVGLGGYVAAGTVGLWTHYSFPIVLAAAVFGYLLELRRSIPDGRRWRSTIYFGLANLVVVLLYLPWLPTAIARVLAWPAGGEAVPVLQGIQLTIATLLVGPQGVVPQPQLLWSSLGLLFPLLGLYALRRSRGSYLLFLWWALPVGLMFGLGLFSEAFLKFLLAASPAWLLLCAVAPWLLPWPRLGITMLCAGALALAAIVLPTYYRDPAVRDNYAGVAAYIAVTADPQQDLVLLDAPGQQEVWQYYDPGVPTLALPQQRPADVAVTIAALADATTNRRNVYALFWATDEADPNRIVESWLDQHAFKGLERWQGNLRFVIYTLAANLACTPPPPTGELLWGDRIVLKDLCRAQGQQAVSAGEAVLLGLHWQATAELTTRYKVSVQLLNERNLVVEQHDGEPVGGSRPTDTWQRAELIVDNHGIVVPIGTPPGTYRLIVALYDANTGERLSITDDGSPTGRDFFDAGSVRVVLPERPLPAALVPVQYSLNRPIGPLRLVGYSLHRQGFAHAPLTPIAPGDPVEFTLVWQAPAPLPETWPTTTMVTLSLGTEEIHFAPAGEGYPLAQWSPGELVRYQVVLPYDGGDIRPRLQVENDEFILQPLPIR